MNPGGRSILSSWSWELETAKQILVEVFHVRPSDVEDMIQRRLDEKSWIDERLPEEEPWPREFCLGE